MANSNGTAETKRWAGIVFAIVLVLYLATLSTVPTNGDSCELAANALLGRVLHPPGYPLYAAMLRLANGLPFGSPASRCALVSAVSGAAACALLFLIARCVGFALVESVGCALLCAASSQMWIQATRVEVYAFEVFLFLGFVASYLAWQQGPDDGPADFLCVFTLVLLLGHRYSMLVIVPVFLLHFVLLGRKAPTRRWLLRGVVAICALLPLSYFAWVEFFNPLVYGEMRPTLTTVLFGDGGYGRYLFAFGTNTVFDRTIHIIELLALQSSFVGLLLAVLGWCNGVRFIPRNVSLLLLGAATAHLTFIWSYGVSDVETMLLPGWCLLSIGFAGLLRQAVPIMTAETELPASPSKHRAIALVVLVLLATWHAAPLQRTANAPDLYHVIKAFHQTLGQQATFFTHKTEESKQFALYYVNEIDGPRRELTLHTYTFEKMTANMSLAREHIASLLAAGREVYVSPPFPALEEAFVLVDKGAYSKITALR